MMTNVDDCIFCQIVSHRSHAYRVLEDERCVAFLDVAPANMLTSFRAGMATTFDQCGAPRARQVLSWNGRGHN